MIEAVAIGVGGIALLLTIAVLILVRSVTGTAPALVEMGKAQVAGERNQLEAEKQRDAAVIARTKAEADAKALAERITGLEATLDAANKRLAELQAKEINDAEGAALVDVSHGVLGAHVSASGATGDTAAGGSGAEGASVRGPGPASGR